MITTLLSHLTCVSICLAVLYFLVMGILRIFQPCAAVIHKIAWGGTLVVALFALTIPLKLPLLPTPEKNEQVNLSAEPAIEPAMSSIVFEAEKQEILPIRMEEEIEQTASQPVLITEISRGEYEKAISPARKGSMNRDMVFHLIFAAWCFGVVLLLGRRLLLHRKMLRFLCEVRRKSKSDMDFQMETQVDAVWKSLLREYHLDAGSITLLLTDSLGPALVRHGFRTHLLIQIGRAHV